MLNKEINLENILSNLYYDETSPSCFRRKFDWYIGFNNSVLMAKAGDVAGNLSGAGYWSIFVDNKSYLVHRVVAKMFGKLLLDSDDVDHIDGCKTNNSPENLRGVREILNSRNRKIPSTNTSGVMGVSRTSKFVNKKEYFKWVAQWKDSEGNQKGKSFSCLKYGNELAFKLACEYRIKMINKRNDEGAAYSERHGDAI